MMFVTAVLCFYMKQNNFTHRATPNLQTEFHLTPHPFHLLSPSPSKLLEIKVKFSQPCSMKSMGSSWENLKIQLELKGLKL